MGGIILYFANRGQRIQTTTTTPTSYIEVVVHIPPVTFWAVRISDRWIIFFFALPSICAVTALWISIVTVK